MRVTSAIRSINSRSDPTRLTILLPFFTLVSLLVVKFPSLYERPPTVDLNY
jgi:hypothetical protein